MTKNLQTHAQNVDLALEAAAFLSHNPSGLTIMEMINLLPEKAKVNTDAFSLTMDRMKHKGFAQVSAGSNKWYLTEKGEHDLYAGI